MSGRLILAYGGSGSGKSAWAERTLLAEAAGSPGSRAVYLAAMETSSPEAAARIARHRAMRARHGAEDFILLEDLGNLLANEIWLPEGAGWDGAAARILSGIRTLLDRSPLLVVVSGDVFADGGGYDGDTMAYIRLLGGLHCALAALAERTVEVVCGIPLEQA